MKTILRSMTAPGMLLAFALNVQAAPLPEFVRQELHRARIPTDAVAIEVREVGKPLPLLSLNATQAVNPASTMKLLTTYAGLEILGPAYRWKTEAYLDGELVDGVLYGNVIFKGYGDPKLTIEAFWLWLRELKQRGLRDIRGDIVLDSSFFTDNSNDPSVFDSKPARAYNVVPNALLLNFNALHLRLLPNVHGKNAAPDGDSRRDIAHGGNNSQTRHARFPLPNPLPEPPSPQSSPASGRGSEREKQSLIPAGAGANESLREAHITGGQTTALLEPELYGYQLSNRITTSASLPCNGEDAYQSRLEDHKIVLEGIIPALCGETQDYFSPLPPEEYFFAVFTALWQELGGQIRGKVRPGHAPDSLPAFSTHISPPLSEAIRDINKFSNNVMARQLFLTLGTVDQNTASIARSSAAVRQWLEKKQLQFPELVLENGAGLSRTERISAQHLSNILQNAARSPYSAELEASLPILGMDGTTKGRFKGSEIAGHAHLKTGSLEGVKSIAGYVHARSGKQWSIVFIINHPNAKFAQPAQDALIEWLQKLH